MGRLREPVSGLTHAAAAVLAAVGLVALTVTASGDTRRVLALAVYGATLVLMFSASAAYHLVPSGPRLFRTLRTLDHAAIYLLIAGTYTPICLTFFTGFWRTGFLVVVWALALVGVGVKVFLIGAPRMVTAGVYLVLGWLSLAAIGQIVAHMPAAAFAWLLAGGALFSLGAVVYMLKRPNPSPAFGFHELWHIFVILGAASHYVVMMAFVAAPSAS